MSSITPPRHGGYLIGRNSKPALDRLNKEEKEALYEEVRQELPDATEGQVKMVARRTAHTRKVFDAVRTQQIKDLGLPEDVSTDRLAKKFGEYHAARQKDDLGSSPDANKDRSKNIQVTRYKEALGLGSDATPEQMDKALEAHVRKALDLTKPDVTKDDVIRAIKDRDATKGAAALYKHHNAIKAQASLSAVTKKMDAASESESEDTEALAEAIKQAKETHLRKGLGLSPEATNEQLGKTLPEECLARLKKALNLPKDANPTKVAEGIEKSNNSAAQKEANRLPKNGAQIELDEAINEAIDVKLRQDEDAARESKAPELPKTAVQAESGKEIGQADAQRLKLERTGAEAGLDKTSDKITKKMGTVSESKLEAITALVEAPKQDKPARLRQVYDLPEDAPEAKLDGKMALADITPLIREIFEPDDKTIPSSMMIRKIEEREESNKESNKDTAGGSNSEDTEVVKTVQQKKAASLRKAFGLPEDAPQRELDREIALADSPRTIKTFDRIREILGLDKTQPSNRVIAKAEETNNKAARNEAYCSPKTKEQAALEAEIEKLKATRERRLDVEG
jgi:hypothetical protein